MKRKYELSQHLYDFVFNMLDSEPEIDSEEAGEIAFSIQKHFELEYDPAN